MSSEESGKSHASQPTSAAPEQGAEPALSRQLPSDLPTLLLIFGMGLDCLLRVANEIHRHVAAAPQGEQNREHAASGQRASIIKPELLESLKHLEQQHKDLSIELYREGVRWAFQDTIQGAVARLMQYLPPETNPWEVFRRDLIRIQGLKLSNEEQAILGEESETWTKQANAGSEQPQDGLRTFNAYLQRRQEEIAQVHRGKKEQAAAIWSQYLATDKELFDQAESDRRLVISQALKGGASTADFPDSYLLEKTVRETEFAVLDKAKWWADQIVAAALVNFSRQAERSSVGENTSMEKAAPIVQGRTVEGTIPAGSKHFYKVWLTKKQAFSYRISMWLRDGTNAAFRIALANHCGEFPVAEANVKVDAREGDFPNFQRPEKKFKAPIDDIFYVRLSVDGDGSVLYRMIVDDGSKS
jgi:hypothetical protein